MANAVPILNLLIYQGSAYSYEVQFLNQVRLTAAAAIGATQIAVERLDHVIPSGSALLFDGGVTATTTALSSIGSETIAVQALTGAIAAKAQADSIPVNFSGKTFASSCRRNYADPNPLFNFVVQIVGAATNGTIALALTDEAAAAIPANCSFEDLPKTSTNQIDVTALQFPELLNQNFYRAGYYWDCEEESSGDRRRIMQGRLWVAMEATR